MAFASWPWVLDDDKIFAWRDEWGFPELCAKVDADDLWGGEAE